MSAFDIALVEVLKIEGGYVDDSDDRGGETYRGISRRHFPGWSGWPLIDTLKEEKNFPQNLRCSDNIQLLYPDVSSFYKEHFWNRIWGDRISKSVPDAVPAEIFDTAVNMGVSRAVTFLQMSLNVLNRNATLYDDLVEDGVMGSKTYDALLRISSNTESVILLKILNVLQGSYYIDIMKVSPTQEKYARGWFSRVEIKHMK